MTRAVEAVTVAVVAFSATATSLVQADISGLIVPLMSGAIAALVGYFSAQITVRVELASLKTEIHLLRAELHRYYRTRTDIGHGPDWDSA
jgi:hypothetical protein